MAASSSDPAPLRVVDGAIRVGIGAQPDWLGPGRPVARPADAAGDPLAVDAGVTCEIVDAVDGVDLAAAARHDGVHRALALALRAERAGSARRGGGIHDVGVGIRFAPTERAAGTWPAGLRAMGHQCTEFGLPIQSDEHLARWFHLPFRPAAVAPLWLCAPDGAAVLLAPLDTFHEQVITFPDDPADPDQGLVWGWHGDLAEVPAGFGSHLAVLAGDSPRALLAAWADLVGCVPRHATDHDTLGRQVSYWTDNGAAYWYRTDSTDDAPRTVVETLTDAVAAATDAGVEIGAVQLDSWFYPHEHTRPFDTDEWVVPPSGLKDWAPRADILPDGLAPVRAGVGERPLVAHCRHLWSGSPLIERFDCWVDGDYAHPQGSDYYEHLLDRARDWGVETFEHDWLVECWTGVEGLRAAPGRPRAWQEGIDRAAAARDMTLQWCMATPADFMQTSTLTQVTSIRTSGDHGYLVSPGFLWAWFLYTNALARVLGLAPFKDVFLSGGDHAEVEALLSALSTGPVGIGDPIGTTDADVVAATCRSDGTIVRPDVPIAACDASIRRHAVSLPELLVGECHTDHDAGRWTQVFCANTWRKEQPIEGTVDLGPAWPQTEVVALDLRTGDVGRPVAGWDATLAPAEWTHHLLAPVLADGLVVFGDVTKHAPVGRARIPWLRVEASGASIGVAGAGETVTISGLAPGAVTATVDGETVDVVRAGQRWSATVTIGDEPAALHVSTR